jgi:hypothetical protein
MANTTQEINDLRLVVKKIIQAYRIRLTILKERHQLLTDIEHNFDNVILKGKDKFYHLLESNLKRERKVLEIVRKEDEEGVDRLTYALNQLGKYMEFVENSIKKGYDKYDEHPTGLIREVDRFGAWREMKLGDVKNFIKEVIKFLELMQRDIVNIERRIVVEENFLERRNSSSFDNFIQVWRNELKGNQKLINHFRKVLKRQKKLLNSQMNKQISIIQLK